MISLPDWMMSHQDGLAAADYEALSEETCRRIEIIDGAVVVNVAPGRRHQHIAYRFANALEAAVGK
ncbi:MAG TPA: hypothetical protein VEO01_20555 [Pseudonocardiaceae bacterium]|nr:hypothetical protein [Pseudonocardiaceae bacterium]